jgi:RNA polymerase sigma-70 factor (ECF subfamily)
LYTYAAPKLLGVCVRYSTDIHEAEDWLHDSFMTIFTKIDTFNPDGNFMAWARRVTVNTCISHIRRKKFVDYQEHYSSTEVPHASDDVLSQLSYEEILDEVNKLPEGYKAVFNLFAVEGYGHKEIADLLEITESTSKTQYRNAKLKLRAQLSSTHKAMNS